MDEMDAYLDRHSNGLELGRVRTFADQLKECIDVPS